MLNLGIPQAGLLFACGFPQLALNLHELPFNRLVYPGKLGHCVDLLVIDLLCTAEGNVSCPGHSQALEIPGDRRRADI